MHHAMVGCYRIIALSPCIFISLYRYPCSNRRRPVGIIGFSQGGILASLVGALSRQQPIATTAAPQCLILISTMKPRDPRLEHVLTPESLLAIPSVHLTGVLF